MAQEELDLFVEGKNNFFTHDEFRICVTELFGFKPIIPKLSIVE